MLLLSACALQPSTTPPAEKLPVTTPTVVMIATKTAEPAPEPFPSPDKAPLPSPIAESLPVYISESIPTRYADQISGELAGRETGDGRVIELSKNIENAGAVLQWGTVERQSQQHMIAQRTYAVVAPFVTLRDAITLEDFTSRWQGEGQAPLFLTEEAAADLAPIYGLSSATVVSEEDLLERMQSSKGSVGVLPFDHLQPTYKVLALNGSNPLNKDFESEGDALTVALMLSGDEADAVFPLLNDVDIPTGNRDPEKLTSLVMTGVTAMARVTAARMERKGYDYPARAIADELSSADITHVSNEIPFIEGCKVNASANNLRFCSKPAYWAALEAIGTDVVGLSGNHVNDFGRKGARQSLAFYQDNDIAIYGSGLNEEEACAPLLWEHNGNTFAFIAALAYWPKTAWATDTKPGACYYYNNKQSILDTVQALSQEVDVVAVELQHYETYTPRPTPKQIREFRELRQAGADIVTGVQSHVPQAMEPYSDDGTDNAGVIVYGLGNLFFDQMWSWNTRSGLIARHSIYDGRVISTEILTTMLFDYAQPRWATPNQRTRILDRIFKGTPSKPTVNP